MLFKTLLTCLIVYTVRAQKPSPCPDILVYEPRNHELDRWYAVATLSTRESLRGIWLTIILDRPAELLGNVFGEATTSDNREFLIKSKNYILEAGTTTPVRFFVKYNAASIVPSVAEINLNGRSICSSITATQAQTTDRNNVQTRPTSATNNRRPTGPTNPSNGRPRPSGNTASSINNGNVVPNARPTSSSSNNHRENHNKPESEYGHEIYSRPESNTRPNRPQSVNTNSRPAGVSSRPGSSASSVNTQRPNSNYNTGSDNIYSAVGPDGYNTEQEDSNVYNNNNNINNRPTSSRPDYGNNRDPDESYENNYNNHHRQPGPGLSVGSDGGEEFFAGDFSEVVNRPASNNIRPSVNRNQQCGTIAAQPRPLISYGQNTTPGQWPWHAALYHSKGIQLMYTCGGTLISTSHIVTAAHCVTKPHTNRAINPQNILVYLGKYNLKKFGSEIQDKEVQDIYVHNEYNYTGYYNDIAILRLAEPAEITNFVRPVCLWDEVDDLNEVVGRQGTVVGWGFDQNRQLSVNLMQAQMPIVSTVKCIYSNREFFSQFTSEKSFCAGFRNGTSVCNGDSGGGMVFPKTGTSGSSTVWQIRGLVSVGVALQGQGICDASQYIVFTDVAKHIDWIQQILHDNP